MHHTGYVGGTNKQIDKYNENFSNRQSCRRQAMHCITYIRSLSDKTKNEKLLSFRV